MAVVVFWLDENNGSGSLNQPGPRVTGGPRGGFYLVVDRHAFQRGSGSGADSARNTVGADPRHPTA